MTSHSEVRRTTYRQLVKRAALALAIALAVAGGIAWQGTGMAGATSPKSAVNWRGQGNNQNSNENPTPEDLAVNWRGREGGGPQNIIAPPAS